VEGCRSPFLFLHRSPAGSRLLDSFAGGARPFLDTEVTGGKGTIEGVLLGPHHPSFSEVPLRSAPGHSPFPRGEASRRPPCPSHWGLGGVLSFKGLLLPSLRPLGGQGMLLYQLCVLPFGLSPGGFHDQVFAVALGFRPGAGREGGGSSSGCARLLAPASLLT
jgi:hypothetical protein